MLQRSHTHPVPPTREELEDDNVTVSTRTDDDPVHLAMHAIDKLESDASDDMEEDQVLYPKQSVLTPIKSVSFHLLNYNMK